MDEERARRIGKNEALFREVNERIGEIAVGNRTDFLCECADPACTQPISLTLEDYEQLRADSNLFGIVAGHEEPDVEAVVDRRDGYVVVKKREGTPADVARSTDPRSQMLDERVLGVLRRLEAEDTQEREQGLGPEQRSRAVAPTTGRFLFSFVAPQTDCEVLEIGGSRGYSSIWLGAGVRYLGGRVLSLEQDRGRAEAWRRNVSEAGLDDWAELREGDAFESLQAIDDVFDVVFLDAEKDDYNALFTLAREKLEPGGVVIADNVLSHAETLGLYSEARQNDPTLSSVTVPLDRGLEVTTVLRGSLQLALTAERGWSD